MNPDDDEHFGRIARLLTPSRRAVLEALDQCGPMEPAQIAECWHQRDPDMSVALAQSLPRMVTQSLWRLDNLGLVRTDGRTVTISDQGRRALH